MVRTQFLRQLVIAVAGTPLACAWAADASDAPSDAVPKWELGAGVGVLQGPAYLGSATQRTYAAPLPFVVYRGERLRANREGLGVRLLSDDRLRLDLSVSGALPVESNNTARSGMRDLPPVIEVGPVLKVQFANEDTGRYRAFHWPLRYASGWSKDGVEGVGWISDPTIRWVEPFHVAGVRVDWGLDLSVKFQNAGFNNFYYGVNASEATSRRAVYQATGGYAGATVNTGLMVRQGPLVFAGFVGFTDLHGAQFVDSPLVERRQNAFGGLAVFWVWQRSETMVSRDLLRQSGRVGGLSE